METEHELAIANLLQKFPYRDLLLSRIRQLYALYRHSCHYFSNPAHVLPAETNHYHITDVHGSMNLLLTSLLRVGAVRYVDVKQPVIYYSLATQQYDTDLTQLCSLKAVSSLESIRLLREIVILPNLELNPEFVGIFTMGGDLFDRGCYSEECFYLYRMLLQQQQRSPEKVRRIWYLLGNHELITIRNIPQELAVEDSDCYSSMLTVENPEAELNSSGKQIHYRVLGYPAHSSTVRQLDQIHRYRFRHLRRDLITLMQQHQLQISYLDSNYVTYSHSFWTIYEVERLMIYYQQQSKFQNVVQELLQIYTSANRGRSLKYNQISFLNQLMNSVWTHALHDPQAMAVFEHPNNYDNSMAGAVWNRAKKFVEGDAIIPRLRMPQIIGHTVITNDPKGITKNSLGNVGKGCVWYVDTGSNDNDKLGRIKYLTYVKQRHHYLVTTLYLNPNSNKYVTKLFNQYMRGFISYHY